MPVRSLSELRTEGVVRQAWDLSCGAAALSTVLTYHLGDPVSEPEIVATLLDRSEPERVRARGGFTLLDLKSYAVSRGHRADGYGRLKLRGLLRLAPAIVPTVDDGEPHFMVLRGAAGDRLLLADPAYGNRTMTAEEFETIWSPRVAFVVRRGDGAPPDALGTRAPVVPVQPIRNALGALR
jgi:predicted double-glycine peptidase